MKEQLEIIQREKLNDDCRREYEEYERKYDICVEDGVFKIMGASMGAFKDYIDLMSSLRLMEFCLPKRENGKQSIENSKQ